MTFWINMGAGFFAFTPSLCVSEAEDMRESDTDGRFSCETISELKPSSSNERVNTYRVQEQQQAQ